MLLGTVPPKSTVCFGFVIDTEAGSEVVFGSLIEEPRVRLMTLKRASSAELADCS